MNYQLISANIVIRANKFNPSIINEIWLDKKGIIKTEEKVYNRLFSDQVSQVSTDNFHLFVLPDQLQLTILKYEDYQAILNNSVIKIIDILKETPYSGVGVNFQWIIKSDNIEKLTQKLFYNEKNKLMNKLISDDVKLGFYISKNYDDVRMKLNILPMVDLKGEEFIQFDFNFHLPIGWEELQKIKGHINNYKKYYDISKELMELINQ